MRIVFMGTPNYAVPALQAILQAENLKVVGVYTPPDRPRGRGLPLEMSPVKALALARDLPVFQPPSLRPQSTQTELASLKPDLILVAAYGKLLPPGVLTLPPAGCLNLHPSLLPRYRGPSPVVAAILNGDEQTGVSLMLLDAGMDTGPVLSQQKLTLAGAETAGTLTAELFRLGADLFLRSLPDWTAGSLKAVPQDEALATVTRKLTRADGQADWTLPATDLERRLRAFTPWPGLTTHWQGKPLRLLAATPLDDAGALVKASGGKPGQVVPLPIPDLPIGVVAGRGILALKRVQMAGRRAANAADFRRGYPGIIGSQLTGGPVAESA